MYNRDEVTSELFRFICTNAGLQIIVNYACKVFGGNFVSIVDTSSRVLASSSYGEIDEPIIINNVKNGFLSEETYLQLREDKIMNRLYSERKPFFAKTIRNENKGIADAPYGWLFGPVHVNNTFAAQINICGNKSSFDENASELCELFANAISVELQKNDYFIETRGLAYESLFNDILDKRLSNADTINKRLRILGKKVKDKYYVVIFRKIKDKENKLLKVIKQSSIRDFFKDCISVIYNDDIVLLVSMDKFEKLELIENEDLKDFVDGNGLIVGVSNPFSDISKVTKFYKQAMDALSKGKLYNINHNVYTYDSIAFYCILDNYKSKEELSLFCVPYLYELYTSSNPNNIELLNTLFTYIDHMKNVSDVVKKLHIHKNTLFYRINKIVNHAELDLNNSKDVFKIIMTKYIIEYLEKEMK